ncbi:hypothetical protein O5623_17375 [Escherichia coli]|nr:hypothetical protein [Escherichia coli]
MTDAFGNALAGQTVSVLAEQRCNGRFDGNHKAGRHGGKSVLPVRRRGVGAVTVSINNSSQSRNVTFIADVGTAQIAELVVVKDGSEADGSTANTLRVRVTDALVMRLAVRRSACWRVTAQRLPRRSPLSRTVGGDQCHQPDGGYQYSHCQQ